MTTLLTRCLDAIHEYGETRLFSSIALSIALKHNLLKKTAHLDTTTLSVYGDYDFEDATPNDNTTTNNNDRLALEKTALSIHAMYGHAKNNRFDIKQMTLLLATTS